MGFAGLAFDQELYPQKGGVRMATWNWDYPGRTRSEQEVRAKAKARGAQMMAAMVQGYPSIELTAYDSKIPETWDELVEKEINKVDNAFRRQPAARLLGRSHQRERLRAHPAGQRHLRQGRPPLQGHVGHRSAVPTTTVSTPCSPPACRTGRTPPPA